MRMIRPFSWLPRAALTLTVLCAVHASPSARAESAPAAHAPTPAARTLAAQEVPAPPVSAQAGVTPSSSASTRKRVALVIGNSEYASAPLANPRNDAADIAELLEQRLGFDTTLHLDLDRRGMNQALRQFGEDAHDADVRLFYYAGHGVSVNGANYLIPVGADIRNALDVEPKALDSARVLAEMESGAGGASVMILDACRDNPLPRATRSSSAGLSTMSAPAGSLILYATAPGQVALDGTGRNGTFTRHLLDSLGAPGVHLGDVAIDVRVAVMQETRNRQVPWSESSLTRRVYLVSPPEVQASASAPAAAPAAVAALSPDTGAQAGIASAVAGEASTASPAPPAAPADATANAAPAAASGAASDGAAATGANYDERMLAAYLDAAESGDALARSRLGYVYDTGRLTPENDREARRWYEMAVRQGDLAAHVNLGVLLLGGGEVPADPARARALFESAAEEGFAPAQTNLGMLYQFGEGVAKDAVRAREWFELAARGGDAEAATSLGDLYSYGIGVPVDERRAREWYLEGAMLGSAAAESELGYLYDQGVGVERDYARAREWFERAAAQDYPRGLYNLAEMYELGKGVAADRERALRLYGRAARLGDTAAEAALSRLQDR